MKRIHLKSVFMAVLVSVFAFGMSVSCSDAGDPNGGGYSEPGNGTGSVSVSTVEFETPDLTQTLSLAGTLLEGKSVTWTVSDPFIASVSSSGTVTSLSGGETLVTAKSGSDTVSFTVKVLEPDRAVTQDPFDLKSLSGEEIEIITCGDSIMRDYSPSDSDQYGLGQTLSLFFDSSKVNVVTSISNGGRSSRYFYNEPSRWSIVKTMLEENRDSGKKTVVLFSFGHNDQRSLNGSDSKVGDYGASFTFAETNQNGTVAGTFYDYMERYIVETRELGAVPIMVSPFVRADFSGNSVSEKGKHNMTNALSGETKGRGNYPLAMKRAAEKHSAIFVDMTSLSAEIVEEYNSAGKIKYFYVDSDNTHERTLGGLELADAVTENLKEQGYLTSYIKEATPRLMVNVSALAMGRLLVGAEKITQFRISNFALDSGTAEITVPDGFGVSLSENGEFKSSLTINTSKDFIGTEVFVKFSPSELKSYNGNMTVTHSSVTPDFGNTPEGETAGSELIIALSGAGKEKSTTGTDVSVVWPMIDSSKKFLISADSTSEDIVPSDVTLVGLKQSSSKTLSDGTVVSRVTIKSGTWPVNDTGAKMDDVYLEYKIPVNGLDLIVNKISFEAASSGGSYMVWTAQYSTDENFSNPDTICSMQSGTKEVLLSCSAGGEKGSDEALSYPVEDGSTLYIRIYPAYKDTKENSGRNFIISNVTVEGLLQ